VINGVGNHFGQAVGIEDGVVVIGDGLTPGVGGVDDGALFVFRPDTAENYPTVATEVLRTPPGSAQGLGLRPLDFENGIVSAVATFGGTPGIGTMFTYSVGPEETVCGTSNGVSTSGYYVHTFLDEDAGPAPWGGPRRGLMLSGPPAGTRYLVMGAFQGDISGSGSLFGIPGLCLVAPFVRLSFGTVGGDNNLAIMASGDLPPISDRFLSVGGTVYLQALCAPPAGQGPVAWTNGVALRLD